MFSRPVFYQLRDLAALLGDDATRLRYSESALALEYDVPSLHSKQISRPQQGLLLLFGLGILVTTGWQMLHGGEAFMLPFLLFVGGAWLIRTLRNRPRTCLRFEGRVRVSLSADRPVYRFETLTPVAGPPPPIGAELPLAAIVAIRVRPVGRGDQNSGLALVEVMTGQMPYALFAALPWPAADELARLLRGLTGLPAPDSSTGAWFRWQGRRLGQRFARR